MFRDIKNFKQRKFHHVYQSRIKECERGLKTRQNTFMLLFVLYYVCQNICTMLPFYHAKMQEWPNRTAQHFKWKKSTAFKQQSYTRSIHTHDPSCKGSKTGDFKQQTMSSLRIMLQFLGLQVQIEEMTSNGKYFQTHTHTFWLPWE